MGETIRFKLALAPQEIEINWECGDCEEWRGNGGCRRCHKMDQQDAVMEEIIDRIYDKKLKFWEIVQYAQKGDNENDG